MNALSFTPSPPIIGTVRPAEVAVVRSTAATLYSPPKNTRSGSADLAAVMNSLKSVADALSGTVFCTATSPPCFLNAPTNSSASPWETAFVSLTTAAVLNPRRFDCAARNSACRVSGPTMRK